MRRIIPTCAGLALAFGLSGCDAQTDWVCEISASGKSADVIDPRSGEAMYTADNLYRTRHPYTGVTTYNADNLRAPDAMAWNASDTATLMHSHLRITTKPDSLKIESCEITDPRKGSFRAASGHHARFVP